VIGVTSGFPINLNRLKQADPLGKKPPSPTPTEASNTGPSFQAMLDEHLMEIGRSQIAYQQYKNHGRLDLAKGAHLWAERQRQELRGMGVNEELFNSNVGLTHLYTDKHPPEEAVAYDFTQKGQVVISDFKEWQRKLTEAVGAPEELPQGDTQTEPGSEVLRSAPENIQNYIRLVASQVGVDPNLLASIAKQESDFDQNVRSPRGAIGIFQLMPGTASSLGVDADDPYQNVLGGAKYIKDKLEKYGGRVELALAAYNAGPGNVDRAIAKAGASDWDSIYRYLPRETRNYVPKVIDAYS
jgi:hypothetical protein